MDLLVGGKRKEDEGGGFDMREVKRLKGGGGVDVKMVAEMVLVLAGIGKIRGGELPSEVERELMNVVRDKLVEFCQDFSPKQVFSLDGFGGVIEDLGLGKFKGPKMSISEKVLISKRKFQMEKSEDFASPPPSVPQSLQGVRGLTATAFENQGIPLLVRVTTQDTSSQAHVLSASWKLAALSSVAAANSTSLPYQLPASEVGSSASKFETSNHPLKDSSSLPLARVERPPFRVDGRPNGSSLSHASPAQAQAHSTWNQTMVRTPGWPVQAQSFSSTQRGSENRIYTHTAQTEGSVAIKSGATTQPATSEPLTTQVSTGNIPSLQQRIQSKNVVQASQTRNSHAEIANTVHKFLQQHQKRPLGTPPSRDYVNKALACQMCHSTVTDVNSILICDNCEKGYHLKCLHTANQKGALKGEWHCLRCLGANHGKPLPPKYGRVMRNLKSDGPSPNKKGEIVDVKTNVQTANGKILLHKGAPGTVRSLSSQQPSESKFQNVFQIHGNEALSSEGETDDITSRTYLDKISSAAHLIPSKQSPDEKRLVTIVPKPLSNSNAVLSMENHSQPLGDLSEDHLELKRGLEFPSSKEHCGRVSSQSDSQKELKGDELGIVHVSNAQASTSSSMSAEPVNSSSGQSSGIDWIGNISEVVDGKIYYQSCRIDGVVYKVHDHVLILFDNGKLTPSKLQAMWEDRIKRSKWVTVNRCYFPSDLPETVGRPCGLETNEVYESACGCSLEAGLIQGPCYVLPPNKFEAEKERVCSAMEGDYSSRSCFVCKWIYDESKGSFRDISC
ncbi:hypothetical protein Leryth_010132 [Lithospermum erythrorhizon]|nr:hypothetical protein Leryth_010132 [Lithospermum erythrorhizon]